MLFCCCRSSKWLLASPTALLSISPRIKFSICSYQFNNKNRPRDHKSMEQRLVRTRVTAEEFFYNLIILHFHTFCVTSVFFSLILTMLLLLRAEKLFKQSDAVVFPCPPTTATPLGRTWRDDAGILPVPHHPGLPCVSSGEGLFCPLLLEVGCNRWRCGVVSLDYFLTSKRCCSLLRWI